ncbi:hypothetical protein [Leptolyngbya sp. 7M]|uniref:hypothetical protein n=1 Tax=Leptolyngbya sp. 7M TaxID=2812896 RepID=UPI001B8D4AD2|nr:hypothetical protein [Leptolyngbya sp. 7M]QYO64370.1 hypothetical protein JVX88_32545 [Leptolyngbya sp. 7M]QYU69482.1 hypothetical protein J4558_04875 [Leptolyngbya sp. 15MV]
MIRAAKSGRSTAAIFAWPIAIFLLGLVGLVVALTGDGWRDAAAWLALAAPVLAVIWALRARRT